MAFLRYRLLEVQSATANATDNDDAELWYSMVVNMDDREAIEDLVVHRSFQSNSTSVSSTSGRNEWRLMSGSAEDIAVSSLIIVIIILSLIIIYFH